MTKSKRSELARAAHRRKSEEKRARRERRVATGGVAYPDLFYSMAEVQAFLGIGSSQMYEHVAAGHLPRPVAPCAGSSARGYYGRMIIKVQADREAEARSRERA
jgi:predicted DNA-binding transcriptional regulator AlpA